MVPNLSPKCKLLLPYLLFMSSPFSFQSWSIVYLHVLQSWESTNQKVVFYVTGGNMTRGKRPGGTTCPGHSQVHRHIAPINYMSIRINLSKGLI